jgi:hypothetical protein
MKFGGSRDGRLTDLVEGNNVTALDVLVHWLSAQMVLDQSVNRDKVIDNSHHDLQLLDAIPNWDKLGCKRGSRNTFQKPNYMAKQV